MIKVFVENKKGFSLVELIVAIGLFFILVSGVMYVVTSSYSNFFDKGDRQTVANFAKEGLEAVQSIAENNWGDINSAVGGNKGLTRNATTQKWEFSGTSNTLGALTRVINIISVSRTDGNIVASGGTDDILTKRVTVTVSGSGIANYVLASYLTDWNFSVWEQTDWYLGAGYPFWGEPRAFDTLSTMTSTSTAGEVKITNFKGTYDTKGTIYTSRINLLATDKKLSQLTIYQNIPTGCTNTLTLELDDNSGFLTPATQAFVSTASYYTSAVTVSTVNEDWARFKIYMTNCNTNKATPTLYSFKLYYN